MSQGPFDTALYALDAGNGNFVGPIRVQPETLAATIGGETNTGAAGPIDMPGSVKANKGNRELGVGARSVTLRFTGTLPTGYSGDNVRIPILRPAAFAAMTIGATGTYLSAPVVVVGRSPENVR